MKSERTVSSIRILRTYPSPPMDAANGTQNEGRKEGRKVLSRRFVNKKVTFPTGGGYSPFIFRLISIQDGKKFGAPLLRRSSSKLEEGVHGDCAASPRHHPFHYAEINLGSLFSYQSRITPKPHHRYVPSHRSSLYPSRRGEGWRMPCWAIFGRKRGQRGREGAAVEGWKRLSGKTMGILAGVPWWISFR